MIDKIESGTWKSSNASRNVIKELQSLDWFNKTYLDTLS